MAEEETLCLIRGLHHISLTCNGPIAVERFCTAHFGFRRPRVVDIYRWSGVRNFSFELDDLDGNINEMGSDAVVPHPDH